MKIEKDIVKKLAEKGLCSGDKFIVTVDVKPGNKIRVVIDGDKGVTIDDCAELSRAIERGLDRDIEDFELQVSSAGAEQPLKMPRQYNKNICRVLKVKTKDGKTVSGRLESADEDKITLYLPADKKKKEAQKAIEIAFKDIIESKVELSFKKPNNK